MNSDNAVEVTKSRDKEGRICWPYPDNTEYQT